MTLFVACGATCHPNLYGVGPLAPTAFVTPPTLEDIIYTVNDNTNRVQQLHSDSAWLSLPGFPGLRATVKLERESRFRLIAKAIGPELDVGSNDHEFWFWAKRSPEPVILFANHHEFAASPTRNMFPVDPHWLIEAIGLVQFQPGGMHEGPYPREDGLVEVRTRLPSPTGDLTRVLVIHDRYGWIMEQHLYDAAGRIIASSKTSGHRYYETQGVSLPHRIEISMPDAQLSLTIEVNEFSINALYGAPDQLWSVPQYEGYTQVNIAAPQFTPPNMPLTGAFPAQQQPTRPSRLSQQPAYRGYPTVR